MEGQTCVNFTQTVDISSACVRGTDVFQLTKRNSSMLKDTVSGTALSNGAVGLLEKMKAALTRGLAGVLAYAASVQGFSGRLQMLMSAEAPASKASRGTGTTSLSRENVLDQAARFALVSVIPFVGPKLASAGISNPFSSFEESISAVLRAKEVLMPVRKYIQIGQYDVARTNVKYCLNQLRVKKAMEKATDLAIKGDVDANLDAIDDAAESAAMIDIQLSQLDSTIYTNIFVPSSDDGLSPNAVKYRDMAYEYYDLVMGSVDKLLALATDKDIKEAERINAKKEPLPGFLFKEFKGEFYRPPTP